MNIRTATRAAATAAALAITALGLTACGGSSNGGVESGAYGDLDSRVGYLYVDDGQFILVERGVASYDNESGKAATKDAKAQTLEALENGDIVTEDIPEVTWVLTSETSAGTKEKDQSFPIYDIKAEGELTDEGDGIIWDGDITDIDELQLDTPVEGAITIGGHVYAPLDSDEFKDR